MGARTSSTEAVRARRAVHRRSAPATINREHLECLGACRTDHQVRASRCFVADALLAARWRGGTREPLDVTHGPERARLALPYRPLPERLGGLERLADRLKGPWRPPVDHLVTGDPLTLTVSPASARTRRSARLRRAALFVSGAFQLRAGRPGRRALPGQAPHRREGAGPCDLAISASNGSVALDGAARRKRNFVLPNHLSWSICLGIHPRL